MKRNSSKLLAGAATAAVCASAVLLSAIPAQAATMYFGNVQVGDTRRITQQYVNTAPLPVSYRLSWSPQPQTLSGPTCGPFRLPAQSFTANPRIAVNWSVDFSPTARGFARCTLYRSAFSRAGVQPIDAVDVSGEAVDRPISGLQATAQPSVLSVNEVVTLNATVTEGSDVRYLWEFGDQTTGEGQSAAHAYGSPGTFRARVTAVNSAGTATAGVDIDVDVRIGALTAANDGPTVLGRPTTLLGAVGEGSRIAWSWDPGDGSPATPGPTLSHTYEKAGSYTASVTASNALGSERLSTIVAVDAPVASLSASGSIVTFFRQPTTFTATTAGGTNVTYSWSFGDGAVGSGASVTHTYASPGLFTATVTAANSVSSAQGNTMALVLPVGLL